MQDKQINYPLAGKITPEKKLRHRCLFLYRFEKNVKKKIQ